MRLRAYSLRSIQASKMVAPNPVPGIKKLPNGQMAKKPKPNGQKGPILIEIAKPYKIKKSGTYPIR